MSFLVTGGAKKFTLGSLRRTRRERWDTPQCLDVDQDHVSLELCDTMCRSHPKHAVSCKEGACEEISCCSADCLSETGRMMHDMDWEAERTTVTDTDTLTAALAAAPQLLEAAACKQPQDVQALPAQSVMLLALEFCTHRLQEAPKSSGAWLKLRL